MTGRLNMDIVEKVDAQIQSLSRQERRKLNAIIRSTYFMSEASLIDNLPYAMISGAYGKYSDRLKNVKLAISLYKKAGVCESDWEHHWIYNRANQHSAHMHMGYMAKSERKDNKTYINKGSLNSNANKIRYPSKKRKTAWKRFYKLFPSLKPKETIDNSD